MKSFYDMWRIIEAQELGTAQPVPLSKITPELAQAAIASGSKDDKISGAKPEDRVPVGSLNPMQKEVIPEKALGMAVGFLLNGKPDLSDMEAIVSSDNYIMDGHHRWAAATLLNPNEMVKVARVGLPASQLVTALNIWTKAKGRGGQGGKGDVSQFAASIPKLVDEAMANGIPGEFPISADQVKQALAKIEGSNGDPNTGAQIIKQNATKLPTQRHPQAPDRIDMPVVKNKAEIDDVIKKLMAGNIDWNAPLSPETQKAMGMSVQNVGAGAGRDASGKTLVTPNATQQNVGGNAQQAQAQTQNVGANMRQVPGTTQQNVGPNKVTLGQNAKPQIAQRQVASTQYEGPSLNEWLILSGIKKN